MAGVNRLAIPLCLDGRCRQGDNRLVQCLLLSCLFRYALVQVAIVPCSIDASRLDDMERQLPSQMDMQFDELQGVFIVAYTGAYGLANGLDTVIDATRM